MAKQFNTSLSEWLSDYYALMNASADRRADMNEVIVNIGYDNQVIENHEGLIKENFNILISLYHVLNRSPKNFDALLTLLKPNEDG